MTKRRTKSKAQKGRSPEMSLARACGEFDLARLRELGVTLTPREMDIAEAISKGDQPPKLSEKFKLSDRTARAYYDGTRKPTIRAFADVLLEGSAEVLARLHIYLRVRRLMVLADALDGKEVTPQQLRAAEILSRELIGEDYTPQGLTPDVAAEMIERLIAEQDASLRALPRPVQFVKDIDADVSGSEAV